MVPTGMSFLPCIGRTDFRRPKRTTRCPPCPLSNVHPRFLSQALNCRGVIDECPSVVSVLVSHWCTSCDLFSWLWLFALAHRSWLLRARPGWAPCFLRSLPSSVRSHPDVNNTSVAMSTRMMRFLDLHPVISAQGAPTGDCHFTLFGDRYMSTRTIDRPDVFRLDECTGNTWVLDRGPWQWVPVTQDPGVRERGDPLTNDRASTGCSSTSCGRKFALTKAQVRLAQAAMAHRGTTVGGVVRRTGDQAAYPVSVIGPQGDLREQGRRVLAADRLAAGRLRAG